MGKFDRFVGKPKKVTITGEELILKPLTLRHLNVFLKTAKEEDRAEAMKDIISLTMKESYPEEEFDVENISVEFLEELTKAIFEVNNIKTEDDSKER